MPPAELGKKPMRQKSKEPKRLMTAAVARDYDLDFSSALGKHTLLSGNVAVHEQGSFKCKTCNKAYKDSQSYLDHINSKSHQARLGFKLKPKAQSTESLGALYDDLLSTAPADAHKASSQAKSTVKFDGSTGTEEAVRGRQATRRIVNERIGRHGVSFGGAPWVAEGKAAGK